MRRLYSFLLATALVAVGPPAAAQVLIATIPVGVRPMYLAGNLTNNTIYVLNVCGNDPHCGSECLYGIAHSSGYAAVLRAKGSGTFVLTGSGGNENAFAMEIGAGLDIPIAKNVQLRPAELDDQLTRFGSQNFSANQSNFKYFGGINFTFGSK